MHGGILIKLNVLISGYGNENDILWIGANDLATQNRWVWSSNGYRIYPYVNWQGGLPTEGAGRCVGIDALTFEWINTSCEKKAAFFCEKGTGISIRLKKVGLIFSDYADDSLFRKRGLCSMKSSRQTLQNLPYFICTKPQKLLFPFFISCYFISFPNECPSLCRHTYMH